MKIILSAAELGKFVESMTPVTSYVDQEKNKDLKEGEKPSNLSGEMARDIVNMMSSKLTKTGGPSKISMVEGDLHIDIDEEFVQDFTAVYFKHVLEVMPPMLALMKVFTVQQAELEELTAKWFPSKQ